MIKHFARRRSSAVGSIDSGGSDAGGLRGPSQHLHKTKYRVLVMGSSRVGKTSIISQFLYDQFSTKYKVGALILGAKFTSLKNFERLSLLNVEFLSLVDLKYYSVILLCCEGHCGGDVSRRV